MAETNIRAGAFSGSIVIYRVPWQRIPDWLW